MDDLIYRAAAIDAIYEAFPECRNLGMAASALEDVPPAQRWIPVTERLPDAHKKVLVFWLEHSEPMIDTAFWQKDAKRFVGNHWIRMEDKITHWRELPEPPKEE